MFVFANLLSAVAHIIDISLTIYMWILIVRAVISWVNPDPYNPIVRFYIQPQNLSCTLSEEDCP